MSSRIETRIETNDIGREIEPTPKRAGLLFPGQGLPPSDIANFYQMLSEQFPVVMDRHLGYLQETLAEFGPEDLEVNVWKEIPNPHSPLYQSTAFVQPVVYFLSDMASACSVLSMAKKGLNLSMVAGHSLGEYEAAAKGGYISRQDGLEIVTYRGRVMQEAAGRYPSKLVSIMGMTEDAVREKILPKISCEIALINAPQVIVVGTSIFTSNADIEALAKENGARRVTQLGTAAAFHTSYMDWAAARLEEFLSRYRFAQTGLPFVGNFSGTFTTDGSQVKGWLVDVMKNPVRWSDVLQTMKQSVDVFVELGPGSSLASLNKLNGFDQNATIPASHLLLKN